MHQETWPCTAKQITTLRDDQGLTWKQVAEELGLGVGKKNRSRYAQHAYEDLTGRTRHESRPNGLHWSGSTNGTRKTPQASTSRSRVLWNDDSDQEEIEQRLLGEEVTDKEGRVRWQPRRVLVHRDCYGLDYNEEILVRYATAFTFGPDGDQPLQVEVLEQMSKGADSSTQIRTLFVHKILKVT